MQNISAIMMEVKLPLIAGYWPRGQVGSRVKPILVAAIAKHGAHMPWVATSDPKTLDERVAVLLSKLL